MFKMPSFLQDMMKKQRVAKPKFLRAKESTIRKTKSGREQSVLRVMAIPRGKYTPGGANPNTRGTYVKNSAIARQINEMHDRWWAAKQAREAARAGTVN